MIAHRLMAMMGRTAIRWPWRPRPIRVEHVRYVNKPARDDIRAKAHEMAIKMGRTDLAERLEGVGRG